MALSTRVLVVIMLLLRGGHFPLESVETGNIHPYIRADDTLAETVETSTPPRHTRRTRGLGCIQLNNPTIAAIHTLWSG
jgi:hypothetical protein